MREEHGPHRFRIEALLLEPLPGADMGLQPEHCDQASQPRPRSRVCELFDSVRAAGEIHRCASSSRPVATALDLRLHDGRQSGAGCLDRVHASGAWPQSWFRMNVVTAHARLALLRTVECGASVTAACRHFQVSRRTYYRWRSRRHAQGADGLSDRSSRPHRSPPRWARSRAGDRRTAATAWLGMYSSDPTRSARS